MAEKRQFGGAKGVGASLCARCEAMLADAADDMLTPSEQAIFDAHMGECDACAQMLADAQRGAAWLEMLREPRPEPPAELLGRILAQTPMGSGAVANLGAMRAVPQPVAGVAAMPAASFAKPATGAKVLPFRSRFAAAWRESSLAQVVLQPRLVMTAAMAFFSIALTMDLVGLRLQDLHARDLSPAGLTRGFYMADARVVQYYEGLRVVYELESRVHDIEDLTTNGGSGEGDAGQQAAPAQQQQSQPDSEQEQLAPERQEQQPQQSHPTRPERLRVDPAPGSGRSRRESPVQEPRLFTTAGHARAARLRTQEERARA